MSGNREDYGRPPGGDALAATATKVDLLGALYPNRCAATPFVRGRARLSNMGEAWCVANSSPERKQPVSKRHSACSSSTLAGIIVEALKSLVWSPRGHKCSLC